jgi:hypothetical protein
MKEVLLKFHSCLYISSGYSTNQLLNPRYYIKPYNKIGTDFLEDNLVPAHLHDHKFVGLTEELGAKVFKHRGYDGPADVTQ